MRFIAVAGAVLVLAVQAGAETYSWVDEQGTYNFTEDLSRVPKKYRGKARVLSDVDATEHPTAASSKMRADESKVENSNQTTAQQPLVKQDGGAPTSAENKLYGGKSGNMWRSEAESLEAELTAMERRVQQSRGNARTPAEIAEYKSLKETYDRKYAEYVSMIEAAQKAGLILRKK